MTQGGVGGSWWRRKPPSRGTRRILPLEHLSPVAQSPQALKAFVLGINVSPAPFFKKSKPVWAGLLSLANTDRPWTSYGSISGAHPGPPKCPPHPGSFVSFLALCLFPSSSPFMFDWQLSLDRLSQNPFPRADFQSPSRYPTPASFPSQWGGTEKDAIPWESPTIRTRNHSSLVMVLWVYANIQELS